MLLEVCDEIFEAFFVHDDRADIVSNDQLLSLRIDIPRAHGYENIALA